MRRRRDRPPPNDPKASPCPVAGGAAVAVAEPIDNYLVTTHAAFEMRRRGIAEGVVRQVLAAPEQRHAVRLGRDVLQSRVALPARPISFVCSSISTAVRRRSSRSIGRAVSRSIGEHNRESHL